MDYDQRVLTKEKELFLEHVSPCPGGSQMSLVMDKTVFRGEDTYFESEDVRAAVKMLRDNLKLRTVDDKGVIDIIIDRAFPAFKEDEG